jgi:transposase InsO family protein
MSDDETLSVHERWARLRFTVVGPLLSSPPPTRQLRLELERLARKTWRHPTKGALVHFALSTVERWYYTARGGDDPVGALRRKPRRDGGHQPAITREFAEALKRQYELHPRWSYKLHLDNLILLPGLGSVPSYSTLRRFMVAQGLLKQPRKRGRDVAKRRGESREVRSYETEYVGGLWHLDFHHGSLKVLTPRGEWVRPILLTILDDRSRLACHAQWYLSETAESLVHGVTQAFLKRGLARAVLMDNGSAMTAAETTQGLARLSVLQRTTLPYSPHQNGKQEVFWAQVEGRLLAMLEGQAELSLSVLNEATQAWVEMEYQRKVHSETAQTPLQRWLDGPAVIRECPDLDELRLAFTASKTRTQRRSDGTFSLEGIRFEVPARFRHVRKLPLRYATWDMSHVWLMDPNTDTVLAQVFPVDKARNAEAVRRPLAAGPPGEDPPAPSGIAPLLKKLMADYAATGLPPAYIPKEET